MKIERDQITSSCLTWSVFIIVAGSETVVADVQSTGKEGWIAGDHSISKRAFCSAGQFQCDNFNCVSSSWRCDGDNDCGDYSDESNCGNTCTGQFQCDNSNCVSSSYQCDGNNDCGDLSDELGCYSCLAYQFQCSNRQCVSLASKCNGVRDCLDGSDEGGTCPVTTTTATRAAHECDTGQWRCLDGECIHITEVCDGIQHCNRDNSDENVYICKLWKRFSSTTTESAYQNPSVTSSYITWWTYLLIGVGAFISVVIIAAIIAAVHCKKTRRRQVQNNSGNNVNSRPSLNGNARTAGPNNTDTQTARPAQGHPAPPFTISTASHSMQTSYPNQPYPTPYTNQPYPVDMAAPYTNQTCAPSHASPSFFASTSLPYTNQPYPNTNAANPNIHTTYPAPPLQTGISDGKALAATVQPTAPPPEETDTLPPAPNYESLYSSGVAPEPIRPAQPTDFQQSFNTQPTQPLVLPQLRGSNYRQSLPPSYGSLPPVQR